MVRIAVHPELVGTGYGSRALELLARYYQGEMAALGEEEEESEEEEEDQQQQQKKKKRKVPEGGNGEQNGAGGEGEGNGEKSLLLTESVKPKTGLPPLLVALQDRYGGVWVG